MTARLVGFTLLGLATFSTSAIAEIKTITSVIDMSNNESAVDEIIKLSNALDAADKSLYLDLTIKPVVDGENAGLPIDRILASNGTRRTVKCDNGSERFSGASRRFDFNFGGVYNHLLLSILHAGPLQAPFSTIACEYNSDTPAVGRFVVRGYFAKSSLSVPTTMEFELRPITP